MRKIIVIAIAAAGMFPTAAIADHEEERCGRYGCNQYEHDYSNNDRNRNRGRDRGAFSPDLQDSPVTICMPESTCHFDRQPDENQTP